MTLPLRIVDGLDLSATHRSLLMPDTIVRDYHVRKRRLPRFFYAVDSWTAALETHLTPHFALWEFMTVDLYEPEPLRRFPRYVPCAVSMLAAHLEVFRLQLGAPVYIAANGGYRSPSHGRSNVGSPHELEDFDHRYRTQWQTAEGTSSDAMKFRREVLQLGMADVIEKERSAIRTF